MGTIDFSKRGGISGKIGQTVTYVNKDGLQVIRAYVKPKNPKTPKQMAHRMKFALVNKTLAPLQAVIKMGYPNEKNAYRQLVGKAYREAIIGAYPDFGFDYGKVKVAGGRLQLPENIEFRLDAASRTATFNWDTPLAAPTQPGSDNDKVVIVLFNSTRTDETAIISRVTRSDGMASVIIPEHWDLDTTHFWFFMTKQDLTGTSESVYFGAR